MVLMMMMPVNVRARFVKTTPLTLVFLFILSPSLSLSAFSCVSSQVHETGAHVPRSKLQTFSKSQQLLTSVWLQNPR